jgi:hypothetical protein
MHRACRFASFVGWLSAGDVVPAHYVVISYCATVSQGRLLLLCDQGRFAAADLGWMHAAPLYPLAAFTGASGLVPPADSGVSCSTLFAGHAVVCLPA